MGYVIGQTSPINTLRPTQNGRHFADDIFKCIFLNENVWISIEISLIFVPKGRINNIPALVQIMAWRRPGDKPLSEAMVVDLPTHICVARPQWVKTCGWPFHLPVVVFYLMGPQAAVYRSPNIVNKTKLTSLSCLWKNWMARFGQKIVIWHCIISLSCDG